MSDNPERNENDTDEFESLYQSFHRVRKPKPSPKEVAPASGSQEPQLEEALQATKRRRDAAQRQREAQQELGRLQEPLDIESARSEFLRPEEPPVQEEKERGPSLRERLGLRKTHMRILGALSVAILLVYVALAILLLNRPSSNAAVSPGDVVGETAVQPSTEDALPTLRPTQTPVPEATATAMPSPTAPSNSQVSTRLDLKVMRNPDNVELRIERGFEYIHLSAYQAAVEEFRYALELTPENPRAYLGLGQAHFYRLHWQEAEEALGTAVAFEEDWEAPHFWLGKLFYLQGRYQESAQEFDWAAEINPNNPVNEAWLGRAAAEMGDVEEAVGAAERALALDEKLAIAHVARAEAYVLQEEYAAAHGDLLHAQNIDPHNFEVLNALARFYTTHMPERLAEAERLAQQAQRWAEWEIEEARALHTLAKVRIAQERTEEAKELLAQASNIASVNGQMWLPGIAEDFDQLLQP